MPNWGNDGARKACGVLYVAQGRRYADLAVQSAESLKKVEPLCPIDILTDVPIKSDLFDRVGPIPRGSTRAKISGMAESQFERTLYLDCDTLVVQPFGDLFTLLDRFDLGICHDVRRSSALITEGWRVAAPEVFGQHNSGVMLYRRSEAMLRFFAAWARDYDSAGQSRDQVTLRDILWESDLHFWVLPPEFNLRRVTELDAWEPLDAVPRIVHSHQLLRHLRKGEDQVTTLEEILALERIALQQEWEKLEARHPGTQAAGPADRFRIARAVRQE